MKCFVINLKEKKDRYKFVSKQLDDMDIPFERFDAINVSDFSNKEKEKLYDEEYVIKKYKKSFTTGELGCALSHRNIYKKMIEENIEECMIIEDDILFDKEKFKKLYNKISKNKKWEYVKVDYNIFDKKFRKNYFSGVYGNNPYYILIIKSIFMYIYMIIEFIQQSIGKLFGPLLLPTIRPLHLSGVYFIRLSGAKKMLSLNDKIQHPADYLQNIVKKEKAMKLYFISPQIVKQYEKFGSSTR